MARTLPWLIDDSKATKCPTPTNHHQSKAPSKAGKARFPSIDSSSPSQSRMTRGKDEQWIMVEDELLETARTFTRHLHVAEYRRMEALAAQRRLTGAMERIARPTDGKIKMSVELAMKRAAKGKRAGFDGIGHGRGKLSRKQGKPAIESDNSDITEEEETAIGDRNLAGLMHNRAHERIHDKRKLTDIIGSSQVNSRANAGFGASQENSPRKTNLRAITRRTQSQAQSLDSITNSVPSDNRKDDESDNDLDLPPRPRPLSSGREIVQQYSEQLTRDGCTKQDMGWKRSHDSHDADLSDKRRMESRLKSLKRHRANCSDEKLREVEERRRMIHLDEIPTFMV